MNSRAVSACVPCFNNESTLAAVITSVLSQTVRIDDVIVVDDGSTDGSAAVARRCGARVVPLGRNLGRGSARARAVLEARHDFVLFVDATCTLPEDFVDRGSSWLADPTVAAVYARIDDPCPEGLVRRWRARHLFRTGAQGNLSRRGSLSTSGCLLRREAVLRVGNFDPRRKAHEDFDLGERLLAAGFDVVSDPALRIVSTSANTLGQVLERYWRWGGGDEPVTPLAYAKQIAYSIKVMARQDFQAGDLAAIPISLLTPHYRLWRSLCRRFA